MQEENVAIGINWLVREHSPYGRITVQMVSGFTRLDSSASLHTYNHIFYSLVKSNLVKLETSSTWSSPYPPMMTVLGIVSISQCSPHTKISYLKPVWPGIKCSPNSSKSCSKSSQNSFFLLFNWVMFSKIAQTSQNISANFVKFVAKNFLKSPNLVTLPKTLLVGVKFMER